MKRRTIVATLAASCFALVFVSRHAQATPVFEASGAVGGQGGLNATVSTPSSASTYFNPAMLPFADEEWLFAFSAMSEQISLTLDGRRGGDVPLLVGARDLVTSDGRPIPNATVPTSWLEQGCQAPCAFRPRPRQRGGSSGKTHTYLSIGTTKHVIDKRLTLGFYAMLPTSTFTTATSFYADERESLFSNALHPELYGDRLTALSMALAAGLRLSPSFSVGAGLTLGMTNAATSASYVRDSADYDTLLLNNDVSVKMSLSPHFGLYWRSLPRLRWAATFHAPQSFVIDSAIAATLPSGVESKTKREEVHAHLPWRAALGIEADLLVTPSSTVGVVTSVQYTHWSDYRDRHGQSPSIYGDDVGARNVPTFSIGVRHRYRQVRGFIDWQFAPSPFPEQVGRSNYVDNDRIGAAAGIDVGLSLGSFRVRPGVQLVGYRLLRRHNLKDDDRIVDELPDDAVSAGTRKAPPGTRGLQTNNPGWPGFSSEGWVYGGTFTLTIEN